jgi:osmotically-inducible protein OsmY
MSKNNETIKKNVVDQLYWDNSLDAANIKVEVSDGRVRLTGAVTDYFSKNLAAEAVWSVQGVKSLDNQLTVNFTMDFLVPPDSVIEKRVANFLKSSPLAANQDIRVSVKAGIVFLQGTVNALWRRVKVENMVEGIQGIVGVENLLTVLPTENIADEIIAEKTLAAFSRNTMIHEEKIAVTVANGKMILKGEVLSGRVALEAYDCAIRIPGVREVANDILIC